VKPSLFEVEIHDAANQIRDVGRLAFDRARERFRGVVAERDACECAGRRDAVDIRQAKTEERVRPGVGPARELFEECDRAA
jgi:hypothetical protein